jgi:hypothetical protein
MYEMMIDFRVLEQRHEEIRREAELGRLVRAPRAEFKKRAGVLRILALVQESKIDGLRLLRVFGGPKSAEKRKGAA